MGNLMLVSDLRPNSRLDLDPMSPPSNPALVVTDFNRDRRSCLCWCSQAGIVSYGLDMSSKRCLVFGAEASSAEARLSSSRDREYYWAESMLACSV